MKFKPLQDMTTLTTTVCVALLTVVTALSGSGLVLLFSVEFSARFRASTSSIPLAS
jgi:uncharacterized membrane protein